MKRRFCSSVPYCMIPGPTQARPMEDVPSGGAPASAISSLSIACSVRLPEPPPYSSGQEKPTQRLSRTFFSHSPMKPRPRSARGGKFSARNSRISVRNACSSGVKSKSITSLPGGGALVVVVGIAERRAHPLGALEIELGVVFRGEADGAVQADAVDADSRECIGRVRLGERRRPRQFVRGIVDRPRRVVRQRFERFDVDEHVGESVLDALVLADGVVELDAVLGVLGGQREDRFRGADSLESDRDRPAVGQEGEVVGGDRKRRQRRGTVEGRGSERLGPVDAQLRGQGRRLFTSTMAR